MMVCQGSLAPREIWRMELTEGLGMIVARSKIGKANDGPRGRQVEHRCDGTSVYPIRSMADLGAFLANGRG
jgi:hypothetical protein